MLMIDLYTIYYSPNQFFVHMLLASMFKRSRAARQRARAALRTTDGPLHT